MIDCALQYSCFWFLLSFFWFSVISGTEATAINRTIDDTLGDSVTGARPIYLPANRGLWRGAGCSECAFQPDPSQVFDETWSEALYSPQVGVMNITFDFTGRPSRHIF